MAELIIDDSNYRLHVLPTVNGVIPGRGHVDRDFIKVPHGSMPCAPAFDMPLIPRNEWSARIKEMEATKTRLSDLRLQAGLVSQDQGQTNYCWCNAVVSAIRIVRMLNNEPNIGLSAASVAAQVKGFSNEGGWGGEALDFIVKNGIAPASLWPNNAISRQYLTAEAKAAAALNKVTEWYDLQPRNFDQEMTLLLLRIPVPIGLSWWSHEVCAIDPVEISLGHFGARFWNSWGESYGTNGMAVLDESRATADNAVAPRVVMASAA